MTIRTLTAQYLSASGLAMALLAWAPAPAQAADLGEVVQLCTKRGGSFANRVARFEALGFKRLPAAGRLWVQGQITHIAMGDLELSTPDDPADLRGTYQTFWNSAKTGDLFRDDIVQQHFTNPQRNIEISLNEVDGELGCSISYGLGATDLPVTLRKRKQWKSSAGTYTTYAINGNRTANGSTLGPVWDRWVEGKRLVSSFFVVSER